MSDTLAKAKETLLLRLRLARACEIRNQNKERNKLLVLAGVNARRLGWNPIAAYCRKKILMHSPGHLMQKYRSFAVAGESEDFNALYQRLEREFGNERVEQLLEEVRMPEHPRQELGDDYAYAAALLGTSREQLESADREPPIEELPPHEALEHQTNWGYVTAAGVGLLAVVAWLIWWWQFS